MLKIKILFLLFFTSISLLAQVDSIPSISKSDQKKLLKKKKKIVYNDSVLLSNNDVLVGEIKKMDKSVIILKTKYSDSDFKIKFQKVVSIKSNRVFVITFNDGLRLNSTINSVEGKEGKIIVDSGVNAFEEDLINVVYLEPIGKNFLSRLTVDIDLGITLTKANNFKQLTSNLSATYLANKWNADGYYKTVFSRQDSISDISRMDGKIEGNYFLQHDWFVQLTGIYLSNDEQKLELRSTYKGGIGYLFKHTNKLYFGTTGGLAYTTENYIDDTPSKTSAELFLGLGLNKYDIGDLSLFTNVIVYPSLTESGRYRLDLNFDMKYDLPLDFYLKLSLTYNYDNKPIEGASDSDYVFTTNFGWEFN